MAIKLSWFRYWRNLIFALFWPFCNGGLLFDSAKDEKGPDHHEWRFSSQGCWLKLSSCPKWPVTLDWFGSLEKPSPWPSSSGMEFPRPSGATGQTGESTVKWQLCYDMAAKTWWMVSSWRPLAQGDCISFRRKIVSWYQSQLKGLYQRGKKSTNISEF